MLNFNLTTMRAKALQSLNEKPVSISQENWVRFKQWSGMAWKAYQSQQFWTYKIEIESLDQLAMLRTEDYEIIFGKLGMLQFSSELLYKKVKANEQELILGLVKAQDFKTAIKIAEQWVCLMPSDADWKYLLAQVYNLSEMSMKSEAMEFKALNQKFDEHVYESSLSKAMSNGNRVKLLQLIQMDHPNSMMAELASCFLIKNEANLKKLWMNLDQHQQYNLLLQVGHWAINFGMSKSIMPFIQAQLNRNRKDAPLWMELKGMGLLKYKNSKKIAFQCLKLGQYLQKKQGQLAN